MTKTNDLRDTVADIINLKNHWDWIQVRITGVDMKWFILVTSGSQRLREIELTEVNAGPMLRAILDLLCIEVVR